MFIKRGIPVADADDFYKELSKRGKVLYNEIVAAFGSDIVTADGEIDRRKLGSIVFSDTNARISLNAIA
ncbi:MAG: dephospho-CoA kinase, partial [bacterium]